MSSNQPTFPGVPQYQATQQGNWNQNPYPVDPRAVPYCGPTNGGPWGNPADFHQVASMQAAAMMNRQGNGNFPATYPPFSTHFPPQQPGNYVHPQQQFQKQSLYRPTEAMPPQDPPSYYQQQHHPYTNTVSTPGYRPLAPPRQPNFQTGAMDVNYTSTTEPKHKTPQQQPPPHLYNGPPVSALVPRFPRQSKRNRRNSLSTASFVGRSSLGPADVKQEQQPIGTPGKCTASTPSAAPSSTDSEGAPKSDPVLPHSSPAVRQPFAETAENQPRPSTDKQTTSSQKPVKTEECFPCAVPIDFPRRLALPNDHIKLNSLHCFLREKVLEIFVVTASSNKLKFRHAPSSSVGRVGFRCGFCASARVGTANAPEDEAPMAVFYPKSISEIYRLVTSWQRCHVRKCKNLPPSLRKEWEELRHDKTRGKTVYWAESAEQLGIVDCKSLAGGIRFNVDSATGKCMGTYNDE